MDSTKPIVDFRDFSVHVHNMPEVKFKTGSGSSILAGAIFPNMQKVFGGSLRMI
ncbi:hypothetical protein [Chryseobacterium koreense]|uniref:hypothetical protein n=1 Tax=Chryseobacterium koreense TaxID=232216 RepID=UPI0026EBA32D|nr:hypothetical protein [Chryseobacterium koreense]